MDEAGITPEKELLNLIEGAKDNKPHLEREIFKRKVGSLFSFGAIAGRISFLRDWLKAGFKDKRFYVDIKTTNRILGLFIFILTAYLIFSILMSIMNFKKTLNNLEPMDEIRQIQSLDNHQPQTLNTVSYYLQKAKDRNIFAMADALIDKESEKKQKRSLMEEIVQNLRLVGISWSDDPVAIIEDTNRKQAFFLKKGQKINDLTVKEIYYKDKVILSYAGQEIELR